MSNFLDNNWVVGISTGLIVLAIPHILKFLVNIKHHLSKKGIIGKFIRNSGIKELRKIKAIRKDDILINREIIKCHAYQSIFWLSIMIYFWFILSLTILSEDFRRYIVQDQFTYNILAIIGGLPVYIFEFLYLIKRDFSEKLLKYRR
ncbi:hypothetical protein [Acinetobacter sp. ANC 3832]|uniref:hypothetical protein n=1 Tax=Acinetobacter sp. ANC 3832 TaxID=1977874 RepID=UPI000A3378D2|nr:hypothetical protein [Acinetobacter sp. ANC 3832]OTG94232.1 hypothetical protein B9T35_07445 [Acinetobacter sp. ANC 3832]